MKKVTYTVSEAKALGLTEFTYKFGCVCCGAKERRFVDGVSKCVSCLRLGGLSLCKIKAATNRHNRKVEKAARQVWGIPVVFGGMNTGTR